MAFLTFFAYRPRVGVWPRVVVGGDHAPAAEGLDCVVVEAGEGAVDVGHGVTSEDAVAHDFEATAYSTATALCPLLSGDSGGLCSLKQLS